MFACYEYNLVMRDNNNVEEVLYTSVQGVVLKFLLGIDYERSFGIELSKI